MTQEKFIALYGEEAFDILAFEIKKKSEAYFKTSIEQALSIHNDAILLILRLLGFEETTGLLDAKKQIDEMRQEIEQHRLNHHRENGLTELDKARLVAEVVRDEKKKEG
ncbi:MAG: hypothetical protein AAB358_02685 [Patescibacteria group bacterium]